MKKFFSLLTLALLTLSAVAGNYVKVTSASDLTSGKYLIVYEDDSVAFNGALNTLDVASNTVAVTINNGVIAPKDAIIAAQFDIDVTAGTIKSASGYYIGQKSDANGLQSSKTEAYTNTITITDGNADIKSSGNAYLRYNAASNQARFRYYKSSSYTGQKAIQLYKWDGEEDPVMGLVPPVFTPNGGKFSVASLAVTVSCPTENANIMLFKVVDGEDVYQDYYFQSGEFYVTETSTYRAYAYKGNDMSDYTTVTFTKEATQCAKPKFTPANGTTFMQGEELDVTINCDTEGATIKYALNDGEFQNYSAPIHLTETTTIKAVASAEGYIDSDEATATYTMVVPETTGPIFNLVTDVTTLADGDHIILVNTAEDGTAVAMGAAKSNNFGSVDVVVNGNQVQTEKANIITLVKNGDNWNLKAAEGYLYAASSSSNHLKAEETVDNNGNANAAISIADNAASIVFQGTNSHKYLRYNPNNGSPIFSCYEEGKQNPVYIYKTTEDVPEPPVTEVAAPVFTPEKNTVFDKNKGLEISINCETEGATIYYSTDNETFDAYNAPFTIFETTTVKAYAKLGELASDTVYAKYNAAVMVYDLEEANALDNKTNFYFQGDAVVTYKNGKNLWIRDEKGSGLIFGNTIASGEFKTGDVLNKGWDAQKYNYGSDGYEKFIPEFQYPNNVKASGVTQTVEPAVYSTITTDNVNEYILMKNQTLTEMKNADGLVFYNKFDIEGLNIEDGKAYDIVGVVTIYHDEPEVYIISATEVSSQTLVGDVDEDGNVNITDVTALIDMLLSDNTKPSGDVNGDGSINITDVTDLIDILLKN